MAARKKVDPARSNHPRVVELSAFRERSTPPVPFEFKYDTTSVWWKDFWGSPVALLVSDASDFAVVVRLVSLVELRETAFRSVRENPLIIGSKDQYVENPLAKAMSRYDAEIRALEDRFGLSPRSRLALNISLGAAKRSLDELVGGVSDEVEGPVEDFRDVLDI